MLIYLHFGIDKIVLTDPKRDFVHVVHVLHVRDRLGVLAERPQRSSGRVRCLKPINYVNTGA